MARTRKTNPYAKDLRTPKYKMRVVKDKRKKKLAELCFAEKVDELCEKDCP